MGIIQELLQTIRDLGALEKRTDDVLQHVSSLSIKIDSLVERVTRLEVNHEFLSKSVRHEIMADIKSELVKTQLEIDFQQKNLLSLDK